jgi:hypothetical protein
MFEGELILSCSAHLAESHTESKESPHEQRSNDVQQKNTTIVLRMFLTPAILLAILILLVLQALLVLAPQVLTLAILLALLLVPLALLVLLVLVALLAPLVLPTLALLILLALQVSSLALQVLLGTTNATTSTTTIMNADSTQQ